MHISPPGLVMHDYSCRTQEAETGECRNTQTQNKQNHPETKLANFKAPLQNTLSWLSGVASFCSFMCMRCVYMCACMCVYMGVEVRGRCECLPRSGALHFITEARSSCKPECSSSAGMVAGLPLGPLVFASAVCCHDMLPPCLAFHSSPHPQPQTRHALQESLRWSGVPPGETGTSVGTITLGALFQAGRL